MGKTPYVTGAYWVVHFTENKCHLFLFLFRFIFDVIDISSPSLLQKSPREMIFDLFVRRRSWLSLVRFCRNHIVGSLSSSLILSKPRTEMSFDSFFSSSMFSSRLVHAITMKVFLKAFCSREFDSFDYYCQFCCDDEIWLCLSQIDGGSCGISSDEGTMETMMNRGSHFLLVKFDDSTRQIVTTLLQ